MAKSIVISEVYGPVLQGEGPVIGRPTIFVRTGGCDFACGWCDTKYAVDVRYKSEWRKLMPEDVIEEVVRLASPPCVVTFSGGNPALQPLGSVVDDLQERGYVTVIETQGSVYPEWAAHVEIIVVSPKGPSSGMHTDFALLDRWMGLSQAVLKFVIDDEGDWDYAKTVMMRYPTKKVFIQPCNTYTPMLPLNILRKKLLEKYQWLTELVLREKLMGITILSQHHTLVYGMKRGT